MIFKYYSKLNLKYFFINLINFKFNSVLKSIYENLLLIKFLKISHLNFIFNSISQFSLESRLKYSKVIF